MADQGPTSPTGNFFSLGQPGNDNGDGLAQEAFNDVATDQSVNTEFGPQDASNICSCGTGLAPPAAPVRYYWMLGSDPDSGGARRGWQVTGVPDLTGALYSTSPNTGPRGGSTPFTNVSIGRTWTVP